MRLHVIEPSAEGAGTKDALKPKTYPLGDNDCWKCHVDCANFDLTLNTIFVGSVID